MGFKIQPQAKRILRCASRPSIEAYFIDFKSPSREKNWLDTGNRYRINCTYTFEKDAEKTITRHKSKHLKAYIGASSPTHVIDGWSFLGRSLDSVLRGDTYSAVHFAYYAELRAAMSLLASEGFGIFSGVHAVVGEKGANRFPSRGIARTHSLIWPLLRYWSKLNRASELLDDLIRPEEIKLSNWLDGTGCKVRVRALGQEWLATWGIDLASVSDDHDSRNLASYRPSEFRYAPSHGAANIAEFVSSLWEVFEPGAGRRFQRVEQYLLRKALNVSGMAAPAQPAIEHVGLTSQKAAEWARYFASATDPVALSMAEITTTIEEATCHLRMISRAALLLFVASGSARQMLKSAGYSSETIAFWWKRLGVDRGLWSSDDCPDDPLDVWDDIKIAIDDLSEWRAGNPSAQLKTLRQTQKQHIHELGAFELVGIWSLLP